MTARDDRLPLSIAHLSLLDVAPPDLVDLAARAGLASVGVRVTAAAPGGIEYPLTDAAALRDMRQRMAATGVSVLYVELVSFHRGMRAADHRRMLETGAALGATRITASGDDEFPIVAERMAEFCDLARDYGMAVDLEFMPFRKAQSLAHAIEIVTAVNRPNAFILVDALHFFRSGSNLADLSRADPKLLGTFQICDAPREAPAADALATEARSRRLLPGTGGLPLWPLIDALPADIPFGVELPIASQYPHLDAVQQAQLMVSSTRAFLRSRPAAGQRSIAR